MIQGNLVSAQVRRGMMAVTLTGLHCVWFIGIYSYPSIPWCDCHTQGGRRLWGMARDIGAQIPLKISFCLSPSFIHSLLHFDKPMPQGKGPLMSVTAINCIMVLCRHILIWCPNSLSAFLAFNVTVYYYYYYYHYLNMHAHKSLIINYYII